MSNTGTPAIDLPTFDYLDPRFHGPERYQVLAELRDTDPGLALDQFGRINVLRYDDVRLAYSDHERFRNVETGWVASMGCTTGPLFDWQSHALIMSNPPQHTAMRHAVRQINLRLARRMAPEIRRRAHDLVDTFPTEGTVDLARTFAFALPVQVIMGLLHLPHEDEDLIAELSPHTLPAGPHSIDDANEANRRFRLYVEQRIQERRAAPLDNDILTDIIATADEGKLTSDELWATVQTLILAGHETSSSALTTGIYQLLRDPAQWAALKSDRTLLPNAAEEILRYEAAVDAMARILVVDTEISGVMLPAGTLISPSIASANRDPRKFSDPDRFDIHRDNARMQLSFGAGIHRCIGAPLAQVEIPAAIDVLLDRLEHVELVEEPKYSTGLFRGFEALHLRVKTIPRDTDGTPTYA
jgi:cytochrome P450